MLLAKSYFQSPYWAFTDPPMNCWEDPSVPMTRIESVLETISLFPSGEITGSKKPSVVLDVRIDSAPVATLILLTTRVEFRVVAK